MTIWPLRCLLALALLAVTVSAASQWTPGAPAPPIIGLLGDGTPIEPEKNEVLPRGLTNMHVLIVFWSLSDRGDVGLVKSLTPLRREFAKGRLQLVSICIDADWDRWLTFLNERRTTTYGKRAISFANDPVWWQLTQAGSGTDCATSFGVTTTPTTFLIQPNGRFFAVNIPKEQLRSTLVKALEWEDL